MIEPRMCCKCGSTVYDGNCYSCMAENVGKFIAGVIMLLIMIPIMNYIFEEIEFEIRQRERIDRLLYQLERN